jgi:hypothetical protein
MRAIALTALLAGLLVGVLTAPAAAASDPLLAALQRAEAAGALPPPQGAQYRQVLARARSVRDRLGGVRRREMASAVRIAAQIAKRGDLTVGRMPAVFLTLERNAVWWAVTGPPAAGSPGENGARGGAASRGRRGRAPRGSRSPAASWCSSTTPGSACSCR